MKDYYGYIVYESGKIIGITGKILKPTKDSTGYYTHNFKINGKSKVVRLHRVLAECFIPNPNLYRVVNHIDGNKTNNTISNLEWVTHQGNSRHAYDNGLMVKAPHKPGESNGMSKLKESDVLYIRSSNLSRLELSQMFGVSKTLIGYIINRKSWRHI